MKKHKHGFRSSIRFLLMFLMVLALIVPVAGIGSKVSSQTAALTALEIFPQIPLDISAPMAPNPKPDNTTMPAGLPAGSIALFQIYGVLDSDIAALEWNIGKPPVTVYSASGTQIIDAPKKGDLVKVYALRTIVPGPLVVEEIKLVQAGPISVAGKPETHLSFLFNGDAGSTTVATMVVGGVSFVINNPSKPAIVSDGLEGPVTVRFDILGIGAVAPAQAPVVKPPEIPAVKPAGAADNTNLTGTVTKIAGNKWTVGTTIVIVNVMTKVENFPAEGDEVSVRGTLQADGSILASRIRAVGLMGKKAKETAKPSGTETRFTGIVNGTGTTMWLIGTTPVAVDANTKIRDNPALGLMAEVRGYQQKDGIVLATQIRNLGKGGGGGGGNLVRFEATVEGIAPTSWVIGGFTVTVNSNTKIKDNPREGDLVEVRAAQQADGTLLATEIRNLAKAATGGGGGGGGSGSGSSGSGSGSDSSGSGSGSSGSGSGSSGSGGGSSGSGSGSSGSGSDSSGSGSGGSGGGGGSSGSGSGSSGSSSGGGGGGGGNSGSGGGG